MAVSFIKKEGYKLVVFFLMSFLFMYSSFKVEASAAKERQNNASSSYIFIFKDSLSKNRVSAKVTEMAKKYTMVIQSTFKQVNKGFTSTMSEQAAAHLAQDPDIKYYEKNSRVVQLSAHPVPV